MSDQLNLIATTAFGLEALTKRELVSLGYPAEIIAPGWIRFRGGQEAICRANLWLRTADRVLIEVETFQASDFDTLFETTKQVAWGRWIPVDGRFPVDGRSIKSQLSSVPAVQRAVKKAIVENLRATYQAIELPETGAEYRCQIALLNDQATLTIDTTGPSLHKRGYRRYSTVAPLKETMAASLIQLSFWNRERPLIDPFCGSGTIPIEAALIGRNMAPGLNREFAAEAWVQIPSTAWEEARAEARDLREPAFEERLIGTDIDASALQSARQNAELAAVGEQIHFQQRSFQETTSKRQHGCVITNPPYGERLANDRLLREVYESIPEILRRLPTWSHFVLTAYPQFEQLLEKQADRRRKLYNGRIECTYYQFHGPTPQQTKPSGDGGEAEIAMPVFGGLSAKAEEQAELFARRLQKRARHLRRWPTRQGITCYRLYDRDIPEIPLVVDRYEDHLHMSEYERPHDRDRAQHVDWLELMQKTAAETLSVDRKQVFLKRRQQQKGDLQHQPVSRDQYELTVNEGGLKFLVNLSDYVDTGLFLDHRITRSLVKENAADRNVLNLFGYTGSFSVYAAAGGAAGTTTVDLSGNYLQWAKRNMELNGFSGAEHSFVKADGREFLRQLPRTPYYDLAIVDPPTFSNSKDLESDWILQEHWAQLLKDLLVRMKPGGSIYFSTNYRQFKFEADQLQVENVREISSKTVPDDFRNQRIHRCWLIQIP
ncbi:MAG TPA: bifunctional 23S rRNA (guanine(2069)-N(7))-methyltransferase RlmK/23S rRNA (guanine(2445)-N(2))-methyltransferase RlmL [Planctomycetaceae bacterium]|nr:bifunctional 23S rRNA (guanine(2069)-N(7))-methyltransferase RlmK/23S rRNA (guanine(2445)-N(2))-methyltransferase RlmL [Planctomycetaceae bacterium]